MDFHLMDRMIHDRRRFLIHQILQEQIQERLINKMIMDYLTQISDILDGFIANIDEPNVENVIQNVTKSFAEIVQLLTEWQVKPTDALNVFIRMSEMMTKAWSIPTHGNKFGNRVCQTMRECGGLSYLISNCGSNNDEVKFYSAKLLDQCLTPENQVYVIEHGLEKIVRGVCSTKNLCSQDQSRVRTGILENLFKHSESTCEDVIKYGGLQAVLDECRKNDIQTLKHCSRALANLSLYGGAENQQAMIKHKVSLWLFPLAFHNDDVIKYYACLAIAILVANKEIEADVLKSGTLNLVEPFIISHDPCEFVVSNRSDILDQSKNWLLRLVPMLNSKRKEARNLAAFHFCIEASIKKSRGNIEVFREIGAVISLKKVASSPDAIASKFAAQALKLMGEDLPHKLIKQVPLWSSEDVQKWIVQVGFSEYVSKFEENRVDGDLLLKTTEENLNYDLQMKNGIQRQRFMRELKNLKKIADYGSQDQDDLNEFLRQINPDFVIYTYSMLSAGVDKNSIRTVTAEHLRNECGIENDIHVSQILNAIKAKLNSEEENPSKLDVFLSYRRSDGKYLASLLKVQLELLHYSVFLDVDDLKSGKFDINLLLRIKQAKNVVLVLTRQSLDRCINDVDCQDWVHKEIIAAKQFECNIIPIMSDDFVWPDADKLPEDMRDVCTFNAIEWNHDYQKGVIKKLETFLR